MAVYKDQNPRDSHEYSLTGEPEQDPYAPKTDVLDHQNIADKENNSTISADSASSDEKDGLFNKKDKNSNKESMLGRGFNAVDNFLPPPAKALNVARKVFTKRNAKGAGATGLIIMAIALPSFLSSVYSTVLVKEQMVGKSNQLANYEMDKRWGRSSAKVLQRMHNSADFAEQFEKEKFASKMSKAGFVSEFDSEGKLSKLSYSYDGDNGERLTRNFDFNKPPIEASKKFFEGTQGREAFRQFKISTGGYASTYRGKAATKVWTKSNVRFTNWLDKSASDKAKTWREKYSSIYRQDVADSEVSAKARAGGNKPDTVDPNTGQTTTKTMDGQETTTQADAEATRTTLSEDFSKGDDGVAGYDAERAEQASKISALLDQGKSFQAAGAEVLGAKTATSAIKGLNVTGSIEDACAIKGALNYAQYIRSTTMALQLAAFSARYLAAADHQKAGIVSEKGFPLFMTYLNDQSSPSGRTYTQSGGFRSVIGGDKSARPNNANLARFSTGKSNEGVLAKINDVMHTPPFDQATSPTVCKTANNTFVQTGGFIVGGAAMVFSLGGSTAVNTAARLTLSAAQSVVVGLTQKEIIKTAAGFAINGSEDGETAGDGLGSGWDSTKTMINSANGLRPTTKTQAVLLENEAEEIEKIDNVNKSYFAKYLDPESPSSMLGTTFLSLSSWGTETTFVKPYQFSNVIINPFKSFASMTTSKYAYAASDDCTDEQIKKHNIKSSVFCSPEVSTMPEFNTDETETILKQKGDIDEEGQPISDSFKQYIENCHSGRPDIGYKPIDDSDVGQIQNGNEDPMRPLNDCFEAGSDSYPGGQFNRYTDWYGYMSDKDNLKDEINETYGQAAGNNGDDSSTTVSGDAKELAQQILDENNIDLSASNFCRYCQQDIQNTADGKAAYGNVKLDIKLLQFLAELGKATKVDINSISGEGCGHSNSTCKSAGGSSMHYEGKAVDFGCSLDTAKADKIGKKYGVKHNFESCSDPVPHWHYSVGGN